MIAPGCGRLGRSPGRGYRDDRGAGDPPGDVDLNHALGEGEGYISVAEWRVGHEQFWHSAELRQALGDPGFTVGDDTLVVAQEFRLIDD